MCYGRNGSAAKINIPENCSSQVGEDEFWTPDLTIRKWQSKAEMEKERTNRGYVKRNTSHHRRNSYDTYREMNITTTTTKTIMKMKIIHSHRVYIMITTIGMKSLKDG